MTILAAIIGAIVRVLLGRWLPPKEQPDAALEATKQEAKAFAAPDRNKRAVIGILRRHEQD